MAMQPEPQLTMIAGGKQRTPPIILPADGIADQHLLLEALVAAARDVLIRRQQAAQEPAEQAA